MIYDHIQLLARGLREILPLVLIMQGLFIGVYAQVFGESARTEFFGGLGFRVFYEQTDKTQLLMDGDEINEPDSPKTFLKSIPAAIIYGANPRFSLIAVIPTLHRTVEKTVDSRHISDTDAGI